MPQALGDSRKEYGSGGDFCSVVRGAGTLDIIPIFISRQQNINLLVYFGKRFRGVVTYLGTD